MLPKTQDSGIDYKSIYERLYFSKKLEVEPVDVVPLASENSGFVARTYLVNNPKSKFAGNVLKVLNNNDHRGSFLRNVSILKKLNPWSLEMYQKWGEPVVPYVIDSGTFEGVPANVETYMKYVGEEKTEKTLKGSSPETVVQFARNALALLVQLERRDVIPYDIQLEHFGFNPETGVVSMIDFGAAYDPMMSGMEKGDLGKQEAIQFAINKLGEKMYYLTKGGENLARLNKVAEQIRTMKAQSFGHPLELVLGLR